MEQLQHFSHEHLLKLVELQPHHNNESKEDEDEGEGEGEDKDELVVEERYVGKCEMCKEEIFPFQKCYYNCMDCDYSLHKFCAQLPTTQQNHPLHPGHNLTLSVELQFHDPDLPYVIKTKLACDICSTIYNRFYNYHCSMCDFTMDIICATMSGQTMDHPSHPHQLQRYFTWMISHCNACGKEHSGTFYHCTTCSWFKIHLVCALLPAKLLIQESTKDSFRHSHLLTLAYFFPQIENKAKFYPACRVCGYLFCSYQWHYRCNKCRYYAHVECATSRKDAFVSSILQRAGLGKIYKNFNDDDHPNLIHYPFQDESLSLLKHHFINKGGQLIEGKIDGQMFSHPHPLILLETLLNGSVPFHDPMKKVEVLCNGCVRPITDMPFYKCSQHRCGFVLHEWCVRLPSEIQNHPGHPEHTLVLIPKVPEELLGVFRCGTCNYPSNGFAYGCKQCDYYVDVHCGFIPDVITHEAHPNHLLLRCKASADQSQKGCEACKCIIKEQLRFHCPTCDFNLHIRCALLLPRTIRHKYDKHPLILRYGPVENHSSEYFCEDEFDPTEWFYHCSICASSMHTACAPLKLQCEQSTFSRDMSSVFPYSNVKFGGTHEITDHPQPVNFVQGINDDGQCIDCDEPLLYQMILKCFPCKFALHIWCANFH